jgi:hypothetical protein
MHDIEPFYRWRDSYIASEDEKSPFFQRVYDEFKFTHKIYNYFIHPQWDFFGSHTLYTKIIFIDYEEKYAILEFIGEWNDCLTNDIMFLKRDLIDHLIRNGISKFALICENVLNFHGSDDSYYEEWFEDIVEDNGWVSFINVLDHVSDEMNATKLQFYVNHGPHLNDVNWRAQKPHTLIATIERLITNAQKQLM